MRSLCREAVSKARLMAPTWGAVPVGEDDLVAQGDQPHECGGRSGDPLLLLLRGVAECVAAECDDDA